MRLPSKPLNLCHDLCEPVPYFRPAKNLPLFNPDVLLDFCLDWFMAFLLFRRTMKMAELQKTRTISGMTAVRIRLDQTL